jgi:hypothetical protein
MSALSTLVANEFPAARAITIEPEPSNYSSLELNASIRDNILYLGAISEEKVNFELKNESTRTGLGQLLRCQWW